ncbi:MAG: hypothetical protein V1791_09425 [Pseudomonadota bacterium]
MVGWGFYKRWAISANDLFRILIKVWKCKRQGCGGYISIQPLFLLPYRQYTFTVIHQVLCARLLDGQTLRASWQRVMGEARFAYQTVQHWVKALSVRCNFWSGIMQGEAGLLPVTGTMTGPARMLAIMEQYLDPAGDEATRLARHGVLLNRYRGSPLCHRQYP